jgi:hypothetical protein
LLLATPPNPLEKGQDIKSPRLWRLLTSQHHHLTSSPGALRPGPSATRMINHQSPTRLDSPPQTRNRKGHPPPFPPKTLEDSSHFHSRPTSPKDHKASERPRIITNRTVSRSCAPPKRNPPKRTLFPILSSSTPFAGLLTHSPLRITHGRRHHSHTWD